MKNAEGFKFMKFDPNNPTKQPPAYRGGNQKNWGNHNEHQTHGDGAHGNHHHPQYKKKSP